MTESCLSNCVLVFNKRVQVQACCDAACVGASYLDSFSFIASAQHQTIDCSSGFLSVNGAIVFLKPRDNNAPR